MGRLIVTENLTLDGVMEEPENWSGPYQSEDLGEYLQGSMDASATMLFGRRTYEKFASFWPTSDMEPFASKLNNSPKFVVSTTLEEAPWGEHAPVEIIRNDLAEQIDKLKRDDELNISVLGSGVLVRTLLSLGLVDELHLFVHPLVLGSGQRLFGEGDATRLQLAHSQSFSGGIVLLDYRPA